jgi:hypothetical protein
LHGLKKKDVYFLWKEHHQEAFETHKRALIEAPFLQAPDFFNECVLTTDSRDVAVSAVLQQTVGDSLALIAHYSRVLFSAERKYSNYEKECFAILLVFEKCFFVLEHKEFELHCDNLAVCCLLKRAKD